MKLVALYVLAIFIWLSPFWKNLAQQYLVTQAAEKLEQTQPKENTNQGSPTRMLIPSLGIDYSIQPGHQINYTSWVISSTNPHYALVSAKANSKQGNTIIYGHNTKQVFANLTNLTAKQKVVLTTDNNQKFTYEYLKSEIIHPTDTTIFDNQGAPQLLLLTCNGFFNENRKVYIFSLANI
jgi:LPXTG-site transpeptidase (sortase) family protein